MSSFGKIIGVTLWAGLFMAFSLAAPSADSSLRDAVIGGELKQVQALIEKGLWASFPPLVWGA